LRSLSKFKGREKIKKKGGIYMKKIVLLSLVGLLILVLGGCGKTPFAPPTVPPGGVEQPSIEEPPEVPEGLEIGLDPAASLDLARSNGPSKHVPSDTGIGTWDPVNRIYTLTTDVNEGIEIDENDLTLDGAGHKITGSGSGLKYGVHLYERSNVTVKNCVVSGFKFGGIDLSYSSFNTLTGNTVNNNDVGIYLSYSPSNTLTDNTVNNNGLGIWISYSSDSNTITDNTVNNNGIGIFLSSSDSNTLTDNTVKDNVDVGIYLSSSDSNTLTDNTVKDNDMYGINLSYSSFNTLTGNTVNSNERHCRGIHLQYSSDSNTLTDNTVNNNVIGGISLSSSDSNTITDNTVKDNDGFGIFLYNYSTYNEVYNNNFINNSIQAYVYTASGNEFYQVKPDGGNYWSDWTSPDDNCDGFVDSPYIFTGGQGQDNLPWVCQDGWKNPVVLTQVLIGMLKELDLPTGIEKGLIALLEAALDALERGNETAAIGQLTGFIQYVEAQSGKKLTEEQAQMLIATAQRIIDSNQ
jgi:parallel beta-helix repeat protein